MIIPLLIFVNIYPNPHLVSSFSETYDFSRSEDNYSYSRNINLTYNQGAGDRFLNDAKVFLTQYYFANRPSFGFSKMGYLRMQNLIKITEVLLQKLMT